MALLLVFFIISTFFKSIIVKTLFLNTGMTRGLKVACALTQNTIYKKKRTYTGI